MLVWVINCAFFVYKCHRRSATLTDCLIWMMHHCIGSPLAWLQIYCISQAQHSHPSIRNHNRTLFLGWRITSKNPKKIYPGPRADTGPRLYLPIQKNVFLGPRICISEYDLPPCLIETNLWLLTAWKLAWEIHFDASEDTEYDYVQLWVHHIWHLWYFTWGRESSRENSSSFVTTFDLNFVR